MDQPDAELYEPDLPRFTHSTHRSENRTIPGAASRPARSASLSRPRLPSVWSDGFLPSWRFRALRSSRSDQMRPWSRHHALSERLDGLGATPGDLVEPDCQDDRACRL